MDKAWSAYEATTRSPLSQRRRRLREWASAHLGEGVDTVLGLCRKTPLVARAYRFANASRTANPADRLMDYQDRLLYAMRYFHGSARSARLALRSMALRWNFHPYGACIQRDDPRRRSPFHDLNGFEYHSDWLHNLLIASSLGGRKT